MFRGIRGGEPANTRLRCASCGAESAIEVGFVKRRRSFRLRADLYCPPCAEQSAIRTGRRAWIFDLALAALLAAWLGRVGLMVNLTSFGLFCVLVTIPHELGHALMGRLVGLHVYRITIGLGRPVWRFKMLGFSVEVKALPFGGATMIAPRSRAAARTRIFVSVLAGPCVNLLLAAATVLLFGRPALGFPPHFAPVSVFLWANAWTTLVNLLPFRHQSVVGPRWSDGGLLLSLPFWRRDRVDASLASYFAVRVLECRENRDYGEAERWANEGLAAYPANEMLLTFQGMTLLDLRRYEDALDVYRRLLGRGDLQPQLRALLLNNIAYTEYLIGQRHMLEEADRFSAEAVAQIGWQPAFLGTRGSVLVALGRHEEGLPLLRRSFAANTDDHGKALNACSIAEALMQRGDREGALEMAATARRLDPDCVLLDRVQTAIA
jgi:tetratricopeptide (TPR) repeat protein